LSRLFCNPFWVISSSVTDRMYWALQAGVSGSVGERNGRHLIAVFRKGLTPEQTG
jgi:hypothetical protein